MKWYLHALLFTCAFFLGIRESSAATLGASVQVLPAATSTILSQGDFRWFQNIDSPTPVTALAGENVATTTPPLGTVIRLRMNIENTGLPLATGTQFTFQYHTQSTTTVWIDVGTSTAWTFYDNASAQDGQALVSTLLASSTITESYNESNPATGTPNALPTNRKAEWDWALRNNAAFLNEFWYFRVVYASSTPLDSYSFYPYFVAASGSIPQVTATTTISNTSGGTFTINNTNGTFCNFTIPASFYSQELQFQTYSYASSSFLTQKPPPSGVSFVGKVYDFNWQNTSTLGAVISLTLPVTIVCSYLQADLGSTDESTLQAYRQGFTDTSWSAISGSTVDTAANTVTFSTNTFSSFALIGSEPGVPAVTTVPATIGVAGGGSSFGLPQIIFEGAAYPRAEVHILKDGVEIGRTTANDDATFRLALPALAPETYTFGVWAKDQEGSRSFLHTFVVVVEGGKTIAIQGIFLAPTVNFDIVEAKRGTPIAFSGITIPGAEVTLFLDDAVVGKTTAGENGSWSYELSTSKLSYGEYELRVKAVQKGETTAFSRVRYFRVGEKDVRNPSLNLRRIRADINGDGAVNLIDFSILAYWYGKSVSTAAGVDLNDDNVINLVDVSILVFYWTG